MITGTRLFSRMRRHTSRPSSPGIITSSNTASKTPPSSAARPRRPSAAWVAATPLASRYFASSSYNRTSSSMIRTLAATGVTLPVESAKGARARADDVGQAVALLLVEGVVGLGQGAHQGLAQGLELAVVSGEQLAHGHLVEARLAESVGDLLPGPAPLPAQSAGAVLELVHRGLDGLLLIGPRADPAHDRAHEHPPPAAGPGRSPRCAPPPGRPPPPPPRGGRRPLGPLHGPPPRRGRGRGRSGPPRRGASSARGAWPSEPPRTRQFPSSMPDTSSS